MHLSTRKSMVVQIDKHEVVAITIPAPICGDPNYIRFIGVIFKRYIVYTTKLAWSHLRMNISLAIATPDDIIGLTLSNSTSVASPLVPA